jgi:ankyrin repeat protein
MKKAMAMVLMAILAMTFLAAASQELEEMNIKLNGAITFGKLDEAKRLVKAGVDVNKKFDIGENRGFTPLILAAFFGEAEIAKVLIDAGADINEKTSAGLTILHCVAMSPAGNKAVAELLIAKGLDVNAKYTTKRSTESQGGTPLHAAVAKDNIEVAEVLIKNGAELNAKLSNDHHTPLHLVARYGHKAAAGLLIAKGADVNAKGTRGETPLDLAISKGHKELVDLLRKHGGISGKK